jgi:iron-sulfur cluster assembly protein
VSKLENNTEQQLPISFTEAANTELTRLRNNLNLGADQYLRIGVKGGGCAGQSFLLAFDHQADHDTKYIKGDQIIIIHKAQVMYVIGLEIDWQSDEHNKGFVFRTPE